MCSCQLNVEKAEKQLASSCDEGEATEGDHIGKKNSFPGLLRYFRREGGSGGGCGIQRVLVIAFLDDPPPSTSARACLRLPTALGTIFALRTRSTAERGGRPAARLSAPRQGQHCRVEQLVLLVALVIRRLS